MDKLISEIIGKECRIIFLGINDITGKILDVDENWIKIKSTKKGKEKIYKKSFISSITVL